MNPAISVIIPTYNRPSALRRAIESILAQTILPIEILICEDGISSETEKIVSSFNTSLIHWIPGKHVGRPSIPRNRGIQVAKGEWLAFLDDDDRWLSNKLEYQFSICKEINCNAVCSNAFILKNECIKGLYFNHPIKKNVTFYQLIRNNVIINSSVLIKKQILEITGGYPENSSLLAIEDYALWLKIASISPFYYITEPLLEYTDEPNISIRSKGKVILSRKVKSY
jgi:teichuronic acid biosynthesis glycosyltransferase TuaG